MRLAAPPQSMGRPHPPPRMTFGRLFPSLEKRPLAMRTLQDALKAALGSVTLTADESLAPEAIEIIVGSKLAADY